MTTRVKTVDTSRPKISAKAKPLKTGSSVIGQAASMAVLAVRKIGRDRTAPLATNASLSDRPAVILRKNSQSNRSDHGGATQAVLMSV